MTCIPKSMFKVDLDASGHWEQGSKKTFYKTYHKKVQLEKNVNRECEKERQESVKEREREID